MKDLEGNPFPVLSDAKLNTCAGTILIPPHMCPVDNVSLSEYSSDLCELFIHDEIIDVTCFTISPHGRRKHTGKYCQNHV